MSDRKASFKVDYLKSIESKCQQQWKELELHNVDMEDEEKFFITVAFPYANARPHVGHAFTITKAEFAARYQRLLGKKSLFPLGFHCTGMPIKACADKLKYEMETFGTPPVFPEVEESESKESKDIAEPVIKDKSKGKKSKLVAKTGNQKWQWRIMLSQGIDEAEIPKFADAQHWLDVFPGHWQNEMCRFGALIDWRRSFITTHVNPYFDSFVRWQFTRLREGQRIKFGKRFTIFSPKDNQPCMDHDRSEGEGVAPQEYVLIKMRLVEPLPEKLKALTGSKVFLVAATLRPETMYGQTNCWVAPHIDYLVYRVKSKEKCGEVYVSSRRAALNMSYQGFGDVDGKIDEIMVVSGKDIMGVAVKAPLSPFDKVYTLPMLTIKESKGTGIVTSVPSDSPDDFAALRDLKQKAPLREKYNISEDMVLPFDCVPIIEIPEFGNLSAVTACEKLKIQSQNDTAKLAEAKEMVYMKGFYEGKMLVGEFKGKSVQEAKPLLKEKLVKSKEAVLYMEPEKLVVSRSGDECVVALCDQWYLDYGDKEWKQDTAQCLKQLDCFHEEVRHNFTHTLDWLQEHACSRTYGLGSKLPWDEKWLIESLSDSTIYPAYYTIAHLLQGGLLKGDKEGNNELKIRPEQLTPQVWDYVFLNKEVDKTCNISKDKLERMRKEFRYWYPVNLRVSGKDLVSNHFTYYMYNHVAMWPEDQSMWPKGVRANGHLLLNAEKMSKSTGNFLTLADGIERYSADGVRLALADAGDSIEDANFESSTAEAGVLRLYTLIEWAKEMMKDKHALKSEGDFDFHDLVFEHEMNSIAHRASEAYGRLLFREALRLTLFEMQKARDKYRELSPHMRLDLIEKFIEWQAIMLSPICPHVSDHIWTQVLAKSGHIADARWPKAGKVDEIVIRKSDYLMDAARDFRLKLISYQKSGAKKNSKQSEATPPSSPSHATVYVAKTFPPWQCLVLSRMRSLYESSANNEAPDNKLLSQQLGKEPDLKKWMKKVMPFVQFTKERVAKQGLKALDLELDFDEKEVIEDNLSYLLNNLQLEGIDVKFASDADDPKMQEECRPGNPYVLFRRDVGVPLTLINNQPQSGLFALELTLLPTDTTVASVLDRLVRKEKRIKSLDGLTLYRYTDPVMGPRRIPVLDNPLDGKEALEPSHTVQVNLEKQEISINNKPVGTQLVYRVDAKLLPS